MEQFFHALGEMHFNKNLILGGISALMFCFTIYSFFFSKNRKETSFWRKCLDILVLLAGFAMFAAFAGVGLGFGKATGIGGYGLIVGLVCFWMVGFFVQRMKARRRNRLINAQYKKPRAK